MLRLCSLVLLVVLLAPVSSTFAQTDPTVAAKPAPLTPAQQVEKAVNGFASAFNSDNVYFYASNYVSGAHDFGYFSGQQWAETWSKKRGALRLNVQKVEVLTLNQEAATVRLTYRWTNAELSVSSPPVSENLNLKIGMPIGGGQPLWQIVPPQTPEDAKALGIEVLATGPDGFPIHHDNAPILNEYAARVGNIKQGWFFESPQDSIQNLKLLGLATAQLAQDYNETYAFSAQLYMSALKPYTNNWEMKNIWTVPATGEAYTFNANLSGRSSSDRRLPNKNRLVLFYEGQNESPIFRYNGRAAIGLADGRVALVTPEEAKNLIWKP